MTPGSRAGPAGEPAAGAGARVGLGREAGLDWLNFFVANLQTAFGPFIAVYLTGMRWTEGQIGLVLSVGTVAAMASQVPAGLLVDAMRSKRLAAASAIVAIIVSCLILAAAPERLPVTIAEILHGFASCMLNPAIGAISIAVAGTTAGALGVRLGRNARWASIGNGIAAALMSSVGYLVSERSVFILASVLAAPGLVALRWITEARRAPPGAVPAARPRAVPAARPRAVPATPPEAVPAMPPEAVPATNVADPPLDPGEARITPHGSVWSLLRARNLIAFAACAAFFTLANAAMLPLAASEVTRRVGARAELVIGACIVVPQLVVALLSPSVGTAAERIGRRPVLLLGFAALPLRGLLFSVVSNPYGIVAIQVLDGVSAAVFGVMLPLIAADISRATGRFNLCMGLIGLAIGLGATLSTTLGGYTAELSERLAFLVLAGAGMVSVFLVWLLVGETAGEGTKQAVS